MGFDEAARTWLPAGLSDTLQCGLNRVVFRFRQTVVLEFRVRRLRFVWFGDSKVEKRLRKNLYGS